MQKIYLLRTFATINCNKIISVGINGGESPQQIYFLHRKGWTITSEEANDSLFMDNITKKGCKYLFINKHSETGYHPLYKNFPEVFNDEDFVIYSLNN